MWTNIVSKKSADQEHASVAQPAGNPIPAQAEALEVPSAEKRSWASVMRLPSFSKERPSSPREPASLGDATAAMRASFHSDDGERPDMLRRSSTDSSRDPCEQGADCLGGGSEGISSLYTSVPMTGKRFHHAASEAKFDLDHVYTNWPSA